MEEKNNNVKEEALEQVTGGVISPETNEKLRGGAIDEIVRLIDDNQVSNGRLDAILR